ncbi:unnamed protein product [Owenia fusiformis]|uniref:ATP synthase subunit C lysine N-methyltransferase n=1 Tax=Owenia fusiformis TaxID=6347 RepID=A0A8S4N2B7_OWEFU|nr:unnamed protein product [Owenia fusiformis]
MSEENKGGKLTKTGVVLLGISGGIFGVIYAVTTPFVLPAFRRICLPYVPATTTQVNNVMKLLMGRTGKVVDLGSGDGRLVHEAAKLGFKASGVELNPWLVWYSRLRSYQLGLHKQTAFYRKDLWKVDLTSYNTVMIFGVEQMMEPLEIKLDKELQEDGQVIACRFPLPKWTPTDIIGEGIDTVWLYKKQRDDLSQSSDKHCNTPDGSKIATDEVS